MRKATGPGSAGDSVDSSSINPVSTEQIRAVARFLPIFETIKPEDFSHSVQLNNEVGYGIGHVEFHPAVREFRQACYDNGFVQSFDWTVWQTEARRYMNNPALVESAKLATCVKLITAHIRFERFCDGHLHSVFESGHLTAILRRLEHLAKARTIARTVSNLSD
jgi:hypothetical protein